MKSTIILYFFVVFIIPFVVTEELVDSKVLEVQLYGNNTATKYSSAYTWVTSPPKRPINGTLGEVKYLKGECNFECSHLKGKVALYSYKKSTKLECRVYRIIQLLDECDVKGIILYEKTLHKRTEGVSPRVSVPTVWTDQTFFNDTQNAIQMNETVTVTFLPPPDKVRDDMNTYYHTYLGYCILTPILFGILFLWITYFLVTKFKSIFDNSDTDSSNAKEKSGKKSWSRTFKELWGERSMLLLSYLFLWFACLERLLYSAIDWRGYRAIATDPLTRTVIDVIGSGCIVTVYFLIVMSWALVAIPTVRKKKIPYNWISLVSIIILFAVLISTAASNNDTASNFFLAFCSFVILLGFLISGSVILIRFRAHTTLSSTQKQLKKLTIFMLVTCSIALILLILLIVEETVTVPDWPLHYVYRILESILFIIILIILRLPSKGINSLSSNDEIGSKSTAELEVKRQVTTDSNV